MPTASNEPMLQAAQRFLEGLDQAQQRQAVQGFDAESRQDWSYLPGSRIGLRLDQMTPAQQQAAHALMKSALSQTGYDKANGVLELEPLLDQLEGGSGWRDPGRYTFTLFGTPSASQPWGWKVEGHHLSLNFTSVTGRIQSVTPAFLGANPATVPDGPRKGWRLLQAEEDLARQLLEALDAPQRKGALLSARAPRDILTGTSRKASLDRFEGLPVSDLAPQQREHFQRLLDAYVHNMRPDVAEAQMAKIRHAGFEKLRFAWAGSPNPGEAHYYRIHGPTVLFEYDNTQNNANHIHSVWRDLTNDFGQDTLQQHYQAGGHPTP